MKKTFTFLSLYFLLGSVYILQPAFYETLKLKTFDSFLPQKEPSGHFVILNITEDDIANEGGYPLSRQTLAQIQINLLRSGAIGVGWVVAFPQPDRFGGDNDFAQALSFAPSVLAMFENDNGIYPDTTGTVILGDDVQGLQSKGVIENITLLKTAANQGIAVARTDTDSLVRRLPLLLQTSDGWVPAFGTEVLKILAGADTYIIKTNPNGIEEIRVKGLPPAKTDSLGRKWISWVDTPQTTLQEMNVQNKFVFVGFTAKGIMPQIAVPNNQLLEPHKIQAALAESILIEDSPYIPDYSLAVEVLIFTLLGLISWLFLHFLGITWGIALFASLFALTGYFGVYFIQAGILIDVTWSLISQFIIGSCAFYLRFREQYILRQQIKKQFEHYLDPRQVKELQKNPDQLKLGGEKKYATFLFTDVRGFTSLSETLEPEEVTYIMNKALTAQQAAVQEYGGMVDKYIGDALMAIFNAPIDLKEHENAAIECAIKIQKNMDILNDELIEKGIKPIAIGIGINSGDAVIGNMGSETRFDYTAIGDAVNTGARLESATKEAGYNLLIGKNTAIKSNRQLQQLKPIKVKGKEKPLYVYTLI